MPPAQWLQQWRPCSPPSTPAGPRGSSSRQEPGARGRGRAGVPGGAGCRGQVGCPGGASPSHRHPSGPGRGHSSAPKHQPAVAPWQTAPCRRLYGQGPQALYQHASGVLPALAVHRKQGWPGRRGINPATSDSPCRGRGPRHPLSLPFSAFRGATSSGSAGSRCGAGAFRARGGGSLPPGRGETSQPAEPVTTPASPRGDPHPGGARVMPKGPVPAKLLMEIFCQSPFRFQPALVDHEGSSGPGCRRSPLPPKSHQTQPRMHRQGEAPSCHCQHRGQSPQAL